MNLRFFLLDSKIGPSIQRMMVEYFKIKNLPIIVDVPKEWPVGLLPPDYDAYLIHLSDASRETIGRLRRNQPWSKVYGLFRGSTDPNDSLKIVDRTYGIIDTSDLPQMVEETRKRKERYDV